MRVATFNVNSIKARLPILLDWLKETVPDVVLLQELKCREDDFPVMEIRDMGYNVAVSGQKSYNGVAILARDPIKDIVKALPGDHEDLQARYIEANIAGVRLASCYIPNGNPAFDEDGAFSEKFLYKLKWLDRLIAHTRHVLLPLEIPVLLGGDFNICPRDEDIYDPTGWARDALCLPESRARFGTLLNMGMSDGWRDMNPGSVGRYTYWDYVKGRFQKDEGLRIDHFLLSPQATDKMIACEIDKSPRYKERPSDHTPLWCELAL